MPTIKVIRPFRIRFKRKTPIRDFKPGLDTLTAEEMQNWAIQGYLADGRAIEVPEQQVPAEQAEDKAKRLLGVFPKIDKADLKQNGVPKVAAVAKALGEEVSAAEIDAAWATYQAAKDKK